MPWPLKLIELNGEGPSPVHTINCSLQPHECPSDIHHRKLPTFIWCSFPIMVHTAHLWFRSAGAHKETFFCCKMMVWIFIFVQTTSCPWRFFSWGVWKSCKDEISHFHFTNIWCWLLGFLLAWSWISSRVWNPIFSPEYETSSIWSLLFSSLSLSLSTWS